MLTLIVVIGAHHLDPCSGRKTAQNTLGLSVFSGLSTAPKPHSSTGSGEPAALRPVSNA